MKSLSTRIRRGLLALAVLVLLPMTFAWRKLMFRTGNHAGCDMFKSRALDVKSITLGNRERRWALDLSVAVQWLSARLPFQPNCLGLALSTGWLLKLLGVPAQIRVGVRFDETGSFHSHAWLVSGGLTVTGGPLDQGFTEIWRSRSPV